MVLAGVARGAASQLDLNDNRAMRSAVWSGQEQHSTADLGRMVPFSGQVRYSRSQPHLPTTVPRCHNESTRRKPKEIRAAGILSEHARPLPSLGKRSSGEVTAGPAAIGKPGPPPRPRQLPGLLWHRIHTRKLTALRFVDAASGRLTVRWNCPRIAFI